MHIFDKISDIDKNNKITKYNTYIERFKNLGYNPGYFPNKYYDYVIKHDDIKYSFIRMEYPVSNFTRICIHSDGTCSKVGYKFVDKYHLGFTSDEIKAIISLFDFLDNDSIDCKIKSFDELGYKQVNCDDIDCDDIKFCFSDKNQNKIYITNSNVCQKFINDKDIKQSVHFTQYELLAISFFLDGISVLSM